MITAPATMVQRAKEQPIEASPVGSLSVISLPPLPESASLAGLQ
jgi:hypothetical protein